MLEIIGFAGGLFGAYLAGVSVYEPSTRRYALYTAISAVLCVAGGFMVGGF